MSLRHFMLICIAIFGSAAVFTLIGALGPPVSLTGDYSFKECWLNTQHEYLWDANLPMITRDSCPKYGSIVSAVSKEERSAIPINTIMFFTTIPIKKSHRVLSRWLQFVIGDLSISFANIFARSIAKYSTRPFRYQVSIGYRDDDSTEWTLLHTGNTSKILDCKENKWGAYSCDHVPLFELWSCHYHHYAINIYVPSLPLKVSTHSGLSPINGMNLFVIHQHPHFTQWWFILKTFFFVLSVLLCLYIYITWHRARNRIMVKRSLWTLNASLLLFNFPLEVLSLWYNLPWITLFNDFRQGLLIGLLLTFIVLYIGEHEHEGGGHLGFYWKQLLLASVGSVTMFVYEFCERGVQVMYPFYSMWGSKAGRTLAYTLIVLAAVSLLLYCVMLVAMLVRIHRLLKKKRSESQQLSPAAQERANVSSLLNEVWRFVVLTILVALFGILGYVLPEEIFLFRWAHSQSNLSLYGAILHGNYALWNVYIAVMTLVYFSANNSDYHESGQKLLTKSSQQ